MAFGTCRPFGRLWWDETVSTVVTRAEPHNQVMTYFLENKLTCLLGPLLYTEDKLVVTCLHFV
jgi:hypothetical protein